MTDADAQYAQYADGPTTRTLEKAATKIERLRAALQAIADEPLRGPGMGEELQEIARAALEGK